MYNNGMKLINVCIYVCYLYKLLDCIFCGVIHMILEGEGEITTVTVNSSKRKSLRSTIPMSVVKNMGLKVGDNISWKYEIRDGEIVTTIRKVIKSRKR
jgi:molybdopterin-binding protein